ncbi:hypothetical protein TrVFT333_002608 [Trichoderma virens FT-333]|nr:hypothetical protein TrVFT333_002608 [Trichoderma virens FT-333]
MSSVADTQCPPGNPDLYGIGVRVGLYTQWVATLLATLFDPKMESTYRNANLIIQWSIFLGLCTQSRRGDSVIGAVVTQYLLFGSLSSLTGDGISYFSHFSGIFRLVFYLAVSSYGCWFWFTGIDKMSQPGCPEIAFLKTLASTDGSAHLERLLLLQGFYYAFTVSATALLWY